MTSILDRFIFRNMCERCPTCQREFRRYEDYPAIGIEDLHIREIGDDFTINTFSPSRIKAVKDAILSEEVKAYLDSLAGEKGTLVKPSQLDPPFPRRSDDSRLFLIPGSERVFLQVSQRDDDNSATVRVGYPMGHGRSEGIAGTNIATIVYKGFVRLTR